jgi:hypothetical protein
MMQNPKPETRNPKEIRMPKFEAMSFGSSGFEFRTSFGIRNSEFGIL